MQSTVSAAVVPINAQYLKTCQIIPKVTEPSGRQVVIDKMNDLFGAEAFTESQVREFVQGLVERLLVYPDLVNQTKVNSKKQFVESPDFQSAVVEAVVDNQEAHNTMADYFFSDGPAICAVIIALADAFYEAAIDQKSAV